MRIYHTYVSKEAKLESQKRRLQALILLTKLFRLSKREKELEEKLIQCRIELNKSRNKYERMKDKANYLIEVFEIDSILSEQKIRRHKIISRYIGKR